MECWVDCIFHLAVCTTQGIKALSENKVTGLAHWRLVTLSFFPYLFLYLSSFADVVHPEDIPGLCWGWTSAPSYYSLPGRVLEAGGVLMTLPNDLYGQLCPSQNIPGPLWQTNLYQSCKESQFSIEALSPETAVRPSIMMICWLH